MANREERRDLDKKAKPFDFKLALKVATDEDYRAGLIRSRNGTAAEPRMAETANGNVVDVGKPRQPGWAEQLTDLLISRQMPDVIMRSSAEQLANIDRRIALFAYLVDDVDKKLAAGDQMRKNFEIPPDILAGFQRRLEEDEGPADAQGDDEAPSDEADDQDEEPSAE